MFGDTAIIKSLTRIRTYRVCDACACVRTRRGGHGGHRGSLKVIRGVVM